MQKYIFSLRLGASLCIRSAECSFTVFPGESPPAAGAISSKQQWNLVLRSASHYPQTVVCRRDCAVPSRQREPEALRVVVAKKRKSVDQQARDPGQLSTRRWWRPMPYPYYYWSHTMWTHQPSIARKLETQYQHAVQQKATWQELQSSNHPAKHGPELPLARSKWTYITICNNEIHNVIMKSIT